MKGVAGRIGLVALGLLAPLLVVEAGLRITGRPAPLSPGTQYVNFGRSVLTGPHPLYPGVRGESIAELFYRYRPGGAWSTRYPDNPRGAFDENNMVTYRLNNRGFRDDDFTGAKPPGAFRVALVGDSITLGEGVGPDQIFAALLERRLRARVPGGEVMNFGVNGYGAHDELVLLRSEVLLHRPDVVAWVWFPNDISHIRMDRLGVELSAERGRYAAWLDSPSRTLNLVAKRLWERHVASRTMAFYQETYGEAAPWDELQGLLREADRSVAAAGGRLVVALFPDLSAMKRGGYALEWVHDQMSSFLESARISHLDLAGAFAAAGPVADLTVHPVDAHPNERGHEIVARELYGFLEARGLLPPPP